MPCFKCFVGNHLEERDRGVEPLSQPWEGWARPIYQSRNTDDFNAPAAAGKPPFSAPALRSQGAWSECRALPGVVDCPPSRPEAKGERTRRPTSSSPVTVFDREMCRNPLLTKTLCDLTGVESDLDFPGQLAIEHLVWPAEITQTLQQAIGHIFQAAEQLHCRALPSLLSQLTQQAALLH